MKELLNKKDADFANFFWTGIENIESLEISNPFWANRQYYLENPTSFIINLMRKPEYFFWTCKQILNIELLPFQLAVLNELWNRPFPMLIMTRGGGKCINGYSIVETNCGPKKIGDLVGWDAQEKEPVYFDNLQILNENGQYNKVEYGWNNGESETIKLRTKQGYEIEGTLNHPIRVVESGNIVWKNLEDLKIGDYIPIARKQIWPDVHNDLPEDLAYWFGIVIGDGGYTRRGRIAFTSCDDELHLAFKEIAKKYFNLDTRHSSDKITKNLYSTKLWDRLFSEFGFNSSVCGEKDFPSCIFTASKKSVAAFIRGLMDTDGCCYKAKGYIGFCAKSENMVKHMQIFLLKFGIICKIKPRLNKVYNRYYWHLIITGTNVDLFIKEIGFGLKRKRDTLNSTISKRNTNIDIIPSSLVKNVEKNRHNYTYYSLPNQFKNESWFKNHYFFDEVVALEKGYCQTFDLHCEGNDHSFVSNGIVSHNSYLLAVYALLKALFVQGSKIVFAGAAYRQAKFLFEYAQSIYLNAPVLRDILSYSGRNGPRTSIDRCTFTVGNSKITAIPIGDGKKIRGERASDLIIDEFSSVNAEICEQVLFGFASVSANPVQNVKAIAKLNAMKLLGLVDKDVTIDSLNIIKHNHTIVSGTCDFEFGHFSKYYQRYKKIIQSKGDERKLAEIFNGETPKDLNWKDYSVIRIPYDKIPEGFMDMKTISKTKATMHKSIFNMEYGCVFSSDTEGFFRRSLIEQCVCRHTNPMSLPSCSNINFNAALRGTPGLHYVIGVDPASEKDNFSIVVIECWPDHRRVVYCWTTTRTKHKKILAAGGIEHDFYRYCARKILDLSMFFPGKIAMDSQGGGVSILEALADPNILKGGEIPIYPVKDPDDKKYTDNLPGRHIIHLVVFSKADWVSDANHGMKKDFEDRVLLFPVYDSVVFALSADLDRNFTDGTDTMEDCILEIEDLKYELTTIQHSKTPSGRERWDTPEVKTADDKKGRLVKDRYSALLMANKIARDDYLKGMIPKFDNYVAGGFAHQMAGKSRKADEPLYRGPDWFVQGMKNCSNYGVGVRKL